MFLSEDTCKRIKKILIDENISLVEIACQMNMQRSQLSNRLHGRYHFKEDEMKQFAAIVNKPVEELFGQSHATTEESVNSTGGNLLMNNFVKEYELEEMAAEEAYLGAWNQYIVSIGTDDIEEAQRQVFFLANEIAKKHMVTAGYFFDDSTKLFFRS